MPATQASGGNTLTLQADRPSRARSRVVDETPAGRLQVLDLPAETAADLAALVPVEAPTVAVVGLGYVGLPIALGLEETGAVIALEISGARIAAIREPRSTSWPRTTSACRPRSTASAST